MIYIVMLIIYILQIKIILTILMKMKKSAQPVKIHLIIAISGIDMKRMIKVIKFVILKAVVQNNILINMEISRHNV